MTDELKPCPFCGEDAEHVHVCAYEEIVRCTNECCFVRPSITCELPEECFELWNTRAAGASQGQADARRTAEYWKAEHLAGNAEIAALRERIAGMEKDAQDAANLTGKDREQWESDHYHRALQDPEVCKMFGITPPSVASKEEPQP
jgi:hypothetical protein